jgi:hypothetical protein
MDAIRNASDQTVRAILVALCEDSAVYQKALDYLGKLEAQAKDLMPSNGKRKATARLSICVQCESSFDEDDNGSEDCQHHLGEPGAAHAAC